MIRRAKLAEIVEILTITKACATYLEKKGIFQWNAHYPSQTAFLNDFERQELYVLIADRRVIGAVTLSKIMDKEYKPITWLTKNTKNLYIHRLCVHPDFQGKGHAQSLMDHAETFAKQQGFVSVRLDTFSQNKRNQKFYETRGYLRLGDIHFPKQSKDPFHCYELVL